MSLSQEVIGSTVKGVSMTVYTEANEFKMAVIRGVSGDHLTSDCRGSMLGAVTFCISNSTRIGGEDDVRHIRVLEELVEFGTYERHDFVLDVCAHHGFIASVEVKESDMVGITFNDY